MSMSTHVIGFKPPDETFKRMKAVWDACAAADVRLPKDVEAYFGGEEPDAAGVEVKIEAREWSDDMREGFEIDIESLPAGVKMIRFYNSF